MQNLKHRFTAQTKHGAYTSTVPFEIGMTDEELQARIDAQVASYEAHVDEELANPKPLAEDPQAELERLNMEKNILEQEIAEVQALIEG
jgi:hypothetical protein